MAYETVQLPDPSLPLLDKNVERLRAANKIYQGHLRTVASTRYGIEKACLDADLVIAPGVNVAAGQITYRPVAEAHGLVLADLDEVLS